MHFTAPRRRPREEAFTMVELALSIAVVAIAMVAIIGVMPLGLNAQKDNRDDTIINQDAQFLMEAIRAGNVHVDELTNYVDFITVTSTTKGKPPNPRSYYHVRYDQYAKLSDLPNPVAPLTSGTQVIGLLSLPKVDELSSKTGLVTNRVVAQMRALSGSLFEKPSRLIAEPTPTNSLESAFRYRLTAEVVPLVSVDPRSTSLAEARRVNSLHYNLYELRLTFQWPVHQLKGRTVVGNGYKTYRTQMAGRLRLDPTNSPKDVVLQYLEPDRYALPTNLP